MKIRLSVLLFLLSVTSAFAQPAGTLDQSFATGGIFTKDHGFQDNITDVKMQPDQKIITAGTALTPSFSGKLLVMRQLTDGTLDASFNDSGIVIVPQYNESYAYETAVRADEKILVAGAFADPNFVFSTLVMRLKPDGRPDSTFGVNGFAENSISTGDDFAYAMTLQPDNKILLAGTAIDNQFRNQPVVVRLLEDGALDSTFGINGVAYIPIIELDNRLNTIAVQPDGKILVAGYYGRPLTTSGQFDFDILVARFNTDGTPDVNFGNNGVMIDVVSVDYVDQILGMKLTSNGKFVVAGFTTLPDFSYDVIMLQYDSTGARDASFGTNGLVQFNNAVQDVAFDVEVQSDGKILLAGTSGGFFFDPRDFLLMRYNANGTADSTFDADGWLLTDIMTFFDEANEMELQADNKILLAGKANNGAQNDACVVRYHNQVSTGFQEYSKTAVSLFPNPASAGSTITFVSGNKEDRRIQVQLTDLSGRIIDTGKAWSAQGQFTYRLPQQLAPGLYYLNTDGAVVRIAVN